MSRRAAALRPAGETPGSSKLKVMLSSTEAEIAAGSNATRRIVYIRNLIGEIFKLPQLPISHVVDNSATPHLTEKMGSSRKTEHVRRWLQFIAMQCCTTSPMFTSAQRTTSSPTALPKSLLHHSGSQCTISCSTFELQFIYLTFKDRGCKPLYNSTTTVVSQLHQPGDISVRWLYTLLVKQQQLPDTYYVTVLRFLRV
jgi:hypothetical protein